MNRLDSHANATPQQASLFWQTPGTPPDFAEGPRCEIDPVFSQQRLVAQVVDVVDETAGTKTFIIRPASRWGGFQPGQYLSIEVDIDGLRRRRNYSISSSPDLYQDSGLIAITVRKLENGHVSTHLHTQLLPGDYLSISEAMGNFLCEQLSSQLLTQPSRSDAWPIRNPVFIAAGSGITPIKSMLEAFVGRRPDQVMTLIVYASNRAELIFAREFERLTQKLPNLHLVTRFTDSGPRVSQESLLEDCPDIASRAIYLCGPAGFMDAVRRHATALGADPSAVRQESFSPPPTSSGSSSIEGTLSWT